MPLLAPTRRRDAFALALAIGLPTLVTWLYFIALRNQPAVWQQAAYGIGKTLQFGWPVVWAWATGRLLMPRPRWNGRGLAFGVAFGLLVASAMLSVYFLSLRQSEFFAGPAAAIRTKVAAIGIQSAVAFVAVAAFYSIAHAWLEEYYWRWFVFGLLRSETLAPSIGLCSEKVGTDDGLAVTATNRLPLFAAATISACGFMAHHVLVLAMYFGWSSPATYLFSAGVAVGGFVWAGLYERSRSLYAPWLSHLLIDAAIFAIGFDVVR